MIFYKKQKNKAFTLVELMVATTLFTIIMLMGVGALVVSSNSAKASQKLRISVDNVNFAMESMARELRMGTYFDCERLSVNLGNTSATQDCSIGGTPGNIIAFTPQQTLNQPLRVSYQLITRDDGTHSLQRCENNVSTGINCSVIVSKDVDINELKFYVNGSGVDDDYQPMVNILIKGVVIVKGVPKSFTLQTIASQRSAE